MYIIETQVLNLSLCVHSFQHIHTPFLGTTTLLSAMSCQPFEQACNLFYFLKNTLKTKKEQPVRIYQRTVYISWCDAIYISLDIVSPKKKKKNVFIVLEKMYKRLSSIHLNRLNCVCILVVELLVEKRKKIGKFIF